MSENLQIQEVQSSTVGNFEIVVTGKCEISEGDLIPWVRLVVSKSKDFAGKKRWEIAAYIYGVFELMCSPEVTILPSSSAKGNLPPKVMEELFNRINDIVGDALESSGFRFFWEGESYTYEDGVDDSVDEVRSVIQVAVRDVLETIEAKLSGEEEWEEIEIPMKISVNLGFWVNRESFDEVRGDEPIILWVKEVIDMSEILKEGRWKTGQAMKISEVYNKLVALLALVCDLEDAETNQGYEDLLGILQEYMERDGEVVIEIK